MGPVAWSLCGGAGLFQRIHHAVDLAYDLHDLGDPRLALAAERAEGGERRTDIAHRIALRRRQRLGIALMAVGRMSLLYDRVDAVDQPLDALGLLEAAFGAELANSRRCARDVVAVGIDVADGTIEIGLDDALAGEDVHD